MLELSEDFRAQLNGRDRFEDIMAIRGEVFKDLQNRTTSRFSLGTKRYFIKVHRGVGWREILKNLLQLRLPVLGAGREWRAIRRLEALDIPTMKIAGYGSQGVNPARLQSFLVTEDLGESSSLEELCRSWPASPPAVSFKRTLIREAAETAKRLHENGVNHRDFYLCHLRLKSGEAAKKPRLYVMDLHRAQLRIRTPERWIIKDLGSIYFSGMDIGLTKRDLFRFLMAYRGRQLREILRDETPFWEAVRKRAERLYRSR